MTEQTLKAVQAILQAAGWTCSVEYPGFLLVPAGPELHFDIGNAGDEWGMDLSHDDGSNLGGWQFGLPNDSTDAAAIAAAALARFELEGVVAR